MTRRGRRRITEGPEIRAPRAFLSRTDAITPVVTIGKAAAGKAHERRFDLPHFVHQRFANSVNVGDLRILAYPDAVVNYTAKIFREVSVDVGRNCSQGFIKNNFHSRSATRLRKSQRREVADKGQSAHGG